MSELWKDLDLPEARVALSTRRTVKDCASEQTPKLGNVVIEKVSCLQKDGTEQPQFYELAVKYDGVGAPGQTVVYGTEENLRELLRDGGIAGIDIDVLFKSVA